MEFLFDLAKQLAASLTPSEFLTVLIIIAGATFLLLHVILKNKMKIVSWLTGKKEEDIDETKNALSEIKAKLDDLVHHNMFIKELERLESYLKHEHANHSSEMGELRVRFDELISLRKELNLISDRLLDEIVEVRKGIQSQNEVQYSQLLTQLAKSQDAILRNLNQLEKIDELMKAAIPEFRGYHRDLDNELSNLSKDIALVERSIQLQQINNSSGINLR